MPRSDPGVKSHVADIQYARQISTAYESRASYPAPDRSDRTAGRLVESDFLNLTQESTAMLENQVVAPRISFRHPSARQRLPCGSWEYRMPQTAHGDTREECLDRCLETMPASQDRWPL